MKLQKEGEHWTAQFNTPEGLKIKLIALGRIILREAGAEACQKGYGTTDPEYVGRYALDFGDINTDGTLN